MVLTFIAALVRLLPRIFDWGLGPAAIALLSMVFIRRMQPIAASGFIVIVTLSMALMALAAGFVAYVGWRFRDVAMDLFLNVGPLATLEFLITPFLHGAGLQTMDLVVMGATIVGSSIAAIVLRWGQAGRGLREGSAHT